MIKKRSPIEIIIYAVLVTVLLAVLGGLVLLPRESLESQPVYQGF